MQRWSCFSLVVKENSEALAKGDAILWLPIRCSEPCIAMSLCFPLLLKSEKTRRFTAWEKWWHSRGRGCVSHLISVPMETDGWRISLPLTHSLWRLGKRLVSLPAHCTCHASYPRCCSKKQHHWHLLHSCPLLFNSFGGGKLWIQISSLSYFRSVFLTAHYGLTHHNLVATNSPLQLEWICE